MKQINPPIAALVFDLDDTLYPELSYVRSGFHAIADKLAQPDRRADDIFEMLWQAFEQGPRDRVFNHVLQQLGGGDDDDAVAALVQLYRTHRPALQLAPAVKDMLLRLRRGYKLGLLSDGYLPAQRLKIQALNLEPLFDHIICTEELGREFWKPSLRPFELMARQLNCPPQSCVYIADNPAKDFIGPNRLHWQSVHLKCPTGVHDAPTPAGGQPQFVIADLADLQTLLPSTA